MTRNQLPEGVGKKIVEALKRQAEADISPVEEQDSSVNNSVPLTDIQELPDIKFEDLKDESDSNDNVIIEEETSSLSLGVYKNKEEKTQRPVEASPVSDSQVFNIPKTKEVNAPVFQTSVNKPKISNISFDTSSKISMPSNVAVLNNLITCLPVGVTKQTGAQIIRQTLEAMGIPMNSVLKEAQEVQEELNSSTRECMLKIQEYKTNILQLEQSVQEYQKNITKINDLVSLFLLTDKK